MIAEHFADLEAATSTARACELLGASRATHYRRRRPPVLGPRPPRPSPPNALGQAEREHIVSVLRSQEYCDLAPAQIWARLLEPGGSVREEPVTHCRVCRHLCRCFPTMVAVDYSRPLEAVIPGTTGKVLGVLARTYAELPIRSRRAAWRRFTRSRQHRDPPARCSRHRLPSGGGRRLPRET